MAAVVETNCGADISIDLFNALNLSSLSLGFFGLYLNISNKHLLVPQAFLYLR